MTGMIEWNQKSRPKKILRGFQQIPKKSLDQKLTPQKYFIRRTTQPGHYRFFLIPPKNPYSNQATQKNTCQIFVPKKIPESKISNPKKILRSSLSLEIPSTPPGAPVNQSLAKIPKQKLFDIFLPSVLVKCMQLSES